jgi:hypothetical protein
MAVYKIFPEKDATIYSGYPLRNTGLDEILEASTFYDTTSPEVSRYLIKFSQDEINDIIQNKIGNSSYQTNLRNYTANITGLNQTTTLDIHPISGSWDMGTGRYSNSPQVTNGVSWKHQTSSGSGEWPTSFTAYVTASYMSTNSGGGVWYTGSALGLGITASQTLSYPNNNDLNVNVTNIIRNWYSASQNLGGFNNDGFIVKQSNLSEFVADQNYVTTIKYFSIDTHTIYPPCLEFKWRDYSFNTGSSANSIINTSRLVATLGDNSGYYRLGSVEKFRINCRPQFPTRTFQTSSIYTTNYYLPTSSYYAIKDLDTNEFVIDFDTNYTQISADNESSYFTLYMNGLEPERYYQVLLKVIIGNETLILDDNYYFKIING